MDVLCRHRAYSSKRSDRADLCVFQCRFRLVVSTIKGVRGVPILSFPSLHNVLKCSTGIYKFVTRCTLL